MNEEGSIRVTYQAREFAKLAGVTVRTLHYYDRLGLLKPKHRTAAGYRLYQDSDLERLEQIVALKFLGLPLKRIKAVLNQDALELPDALRVQRRALEDKRRLLDCAISAIREAESSMQRGAPPDAAVLKKIIEVIEMKNNTDWMMKYYSDEAKATVEARKPAWSPELQERVSKEWTGLMREVEAAAGEDPAGEHARSLAGRWMKLVEGFTGGDPQVTAGVKALYADRAHWPADFKQQWAPFSMPREACDFIFKAIELRANAKNGD